MKPEEITLDWFYERVFERDGCLIWNGACGCEGTQPQSRFGRKVLNVRRVLWGLIHEKKVARTDQVGIICEDKRCVHPDHIIARKRGEQLAGIRMTPQHRKKMVDTLRARSKLTEQGVIEAQDGTVSVTKWAEKHGCHKSYYYLIQRGFARRAIMFSNPFAGLGA